MATHTPAWKRLGLKLKYAKEQPDRLNTAVLTKTHDHDFEASERPVKRQRIVKNYSVASLRQNGVHSSSEASTQIRAPKDAETTNGLPQPSSNLTTSPNERKQRKKSVTFTEETKNDDGDSRTTIDFPAGSPGLTPRKSKNPSKLSPGSDSPESSAAYANSNVSEHSPVSKESTTLTRKAPKIKSGSKSKTSKNSTKDKSGTALDYLTQHRFAHESWKFNKIIDVWILNHALDGQAIPSTHVPALAGYVRGLPAKAGSRDRLVKECQEAISSSRLDADTIETDRPLFVQFIESQEGLLKDATCLDGFLQSHSRAAVLLWALDESVGGLNNSSPMSQASGSQGVPAAKKKKSRTTAPIDISSSSESDSDSDSSDDPSDAEGEKNSRGSVRTIRTTSGSASKDDISSSGTSSSEDEEDTSSSASSRDSSSDDEDDE